MYDSRPGAMPTGANRGEVMSEWRPEEGWVNLYSIAYESHKDTQPNLAVQFGMQGLAYEDGADAMLTALKEQSVRVDVGVDKGIVNLPFHGGSHGFVVFIPDKE